MITGFVVALPNEINSLAKIKISQRDCAFINQKTLITRSGAGPENAAKAAQLLIDNGAQRLISWGCASALTMSLHPGDLVIPKTLHPEGKNQLSPIRLASPWLQQVISHLSELNPHIGSIAESSSIIAKSSAKKLIYKQTRAIALDMESIAVAKIAHKNHVAILVIRSIADPVTLDLPQAVYYAFNQRGDITIIKLLRFVLTHPTQLPSLIKLGLNFKAAKNKLRLVAKHLDAIVGFEQQAM